MKKQRPCSQPDVRHLLIENLDHCLMGVEPKGQWVHWQAEHDPNPGDILQLCDRPDYPRSLKAPR